MPNTSWLILKSRTCGSSRAGERPVWLLELRAVATVGGRDVWYARHTARSLLSDRRLVNPDNILDQELEDVLGTAAPALRAWGAVRGLRWSLDRRLTEGQSGAIVAFVFELDRLAGSTKLLMKIDSYPDIELEHSGFARHRAALRDAPAEFARLHLAELAPEGRDLVAVGDGRWIVFQKIANMPTDGIDESGEIHDLDVLSNALISVSMSGAAAPTPLLRDPLSCAPDVFVHFCGRVTRTVLHDWAGKPHLEPMNAVRYLREHLLSRLDDGQPLKIIAGLITHDWLRIGEDREPQPNPFVLLRDDGPGKSGSSKLTGQERCGLFRQ
jgi:hypothetical protein